MGSRSAWVPRRRLLRGRTCSPLPGPSIAYAAGRDARDPRLPRDHREGACVVVGRAPRSRRRRVLRSRRRGAAPATRPRPPTVTPTCCWRRRRGCGRPRPASALFDDVLAVIDEHFWSEADGAAATEDYDREWRTLEPYRGVNSNMHLCESLLGRGGRSSSARARRAGATSGRQFIGGQARDATAGCSPSTTTPPGSPMLEHNRDRIRRSLPSRTARPSGIRWSGRASCSEPVSRPAASTASSLEMSEAMFDARA